MSWDFRRLAVAELGADKLAQIERVYLASFPPSEREPFSTMVDDVRRSRATLFAALDQGAVAGFGVTLALPIQDTAYLGYLAVDPAWRGGGIGGQLFRTILEEPAARGGSTALVWEVERPEADAAAEDPRRRRIAFYVRHGGVLLDQVRDFQMPDLAPRPPGCGMGTVPALLMWASATGRAIPTRGEILALVAAVYRVGYGRDLHDPLVQYVLGRVATDDRHPGEGR